MATFHYRAITKPGKLAEIVIKNLVRSGNRLDDDFVIVRIETDLFAGIESPATHRDPETADGHYPAR